MDSLAKLLSNLKVVSERESHEEVLQCSSGILKLSPDNEPAKRARLVALLKLDRFQQILELAPKDSVFYGYAAYKLGKYEEVPSKVSNNRALEHVILQTWYKQENAESLDLIEKLKAGPYEVSGEELDLLVNESALHALFRRVPEIAIDSEDGIGYDILFNVASSYISVDNERALQLLYKCKEVAEVSLSTDEFEHEIVPILVQTAYVLQLQGKNTDALEIFNEISIEGITDSAVKSVALNNLAVLNPDANPNITLKHMDGSSPADLTKSSAYGIEYNKLLLQHMAGMNVRRACKRLSKKYGKHDLLCAVNKQNKAKLGSGIGDLGSTLSLAAWFIEHGKYEAALKYLKVNHDGYQPGIIGTIVSIYGVLGRSKASTSLLKEAFTYWRENGAQFNLYSREFAYPALLLAIEGATDEEAQHLSQEFFGKYPIDLIKDSEFEQEIANVDVESLNEAGIQPLIDGENRNASSQKPQNDSARDEGPTTKKRRTNKPAKSYDAKKEADPERWLPLRDRSNYKPKKSKRKGQSQLTQGAAAAGNSETESKQNNSQSSVVKAKNKRKGKKR